MSPQAIRDEEELERLAGLQLRDSLVRGLGVSEQLQAVLDTDPTPSTTRAPSALSIKDSTTSNPLFYTSHIYHQDSGIDDSLSGASSSTEQCYSTYLADSASNLFATTPLSSLPGSRYQLGHLSNPPAHGLTKRYQGQSRPAQNTTASVKSLSAAYNRPACAFGNRCVVVNIMIKLCLFVCNS